MRKIAVIGAVACAFTACKPNVSLTTPPSAGEAIFKNYLAVGNGYTAGFADASLTVTSQLNSYPRRLFEQFKTIKDNNGADDFIQPLLHGDNGYPGPKKVLSNVTTQCTGETMLSPIDYPNFVADPADALPYVSPSATGQVNNIGIPSFRVVDYKFPNFVLANRYAKRFFSNTSGTAGWRPLDELSYRVRTQHPTFFTFWMGIDDVLSYAFGGGQGDGTGKALPIATGIYNQADISNFDTFAAYYDTALQVTISNSAKGALINVPNILELPFFTTIPYNGLHITRQSLVDSLTKMYPPAAGEKAFQIGDNPFIIKDHLGKTRQIVKGELILLSTPLDNIRCSGWGSTVPIPEQYVLTTDEEQAIKVAIEKYNTIIKKQADLHNLAYVDMNSYMTNLFKGYSYNGIKYTADYVSGGAYSLDGIHPTQRGYALLANHIISTINTFYKSTVPLTDANKYPGIVFP